MNSNRLCWYVGEACLRALKAREDISPRVLNSLEALARFLVSEARLIENGDHRAGGSKSSDGVTPARRRETKEAVPGDRVKDAPALARELRWRVRLAAHGSSDAEDDSAESSTRAGAKRRRKEAAEVNGENGHISPIRLRNFEPKRWDALEAHSTEQERTRRRTLNGCIRPPVSSVGAETDGEGKWAQSWLKFDDLDGGKEDTGMDVDVENSQPEIVKKREEMVRVRRTERGLERQRVVRTVELWEWDGPDNTAV